MKQKYIVKYDQEIVDYAKDLYLTIDSNGYRKYSFEKIAKIVRRRFDVKLTKQTVKNWADRFGWDDLLKKAVVASTRSNKVKTDETVETITRVVDSFLVDEHLIEKLAKVKRWVIVNHIEMAKKLYEEIQKRDAKDKAFARLCEVTDRVGKSIYEMLADVDKEDEEKEGHPIIIINEISSVSNSE